MKNKNVDKVRVLLNLSKRIIGVKFVDFKEDFELLDIPISEKKGSMCFHTREAMNGNLFKIIGSNVACDYGKYAVGLAKPDSTILEGRSLEYCGLSESNAIGKNTISSMKYIDHSLYGLILGPLDQMIAADIVVIVDYAETIMRVMQGYAYKFGNPENLSCFGNQAACADLISKPYSNNDINISLLCKGARLYGKFEKGELGVAMPINIFDSVAEGIAKTFSPVANVLEKKRVLKELDEDNDFRKDIDMSYSYGIGLKEYDNYVDSIRQK